ncbi:MAG: acylphosphatase [Bacteroidetes bacterium]|nr:acylphosphatase [Bacteroidota bacterium]
MKRYALTISGKVQGVFYRKSAAAEAQRIGITGFVKNLSNGNVYSEAQGSETQLDEFIRWCKRGPVRANVEQVEIIELTLQTGETGFVVK